MTDFIMTILFVRSKHRFSPNLYKTVDGRTYVCTNGRTDGHFGPFCVCLCVNQMETCNPVSGSGDFFGFPGHSILDKFSRHFPGLSPRNFFLRLFLPDISPEQLPQSQLSSAHHNPRAAWFMSSLQHGSDDLKYL